MFTDRVKYCTGLALQHSIPASLPLTLSLADVDPDSQRIEAALEAADLAALKSLWRRNRAAASVARQQGDMAVVIGLVRGTKTIQRIADARGVILSVKETTRPEATASGEG